MKPDDARSLLVYLREDEQPYRARIAECGLETVFCANETEIEQHISEADIILGSIAFPGRLLERAARLQWIQVTGAGVDRFLTTAELPQGVRLTRAADVGFGEQMAEYVFGHLLARAQRVDEIQELQSRKTWRPLTATWLAGRTLGVAGIGSIGQVIARVAAAFSMQVVGLSRTGRPCHPFERVFAPEELHEFLAQLDVLVLALPLTRETTGMIDASALRAMRDDATLVNVARGAIVDEDALIEALRHGEIGAAILDVFCEEPLSKESPLWTLPQVTITSHHAGLNRPEKIAELFLENLRRFRSGCPLLGEVDPNQGY